MNLTLVTQLKLSHLSLSWSWCAHKGRKQNPVHPLPNAFGYSHLIISPRPCPVLALTSTMVMGWPHVKQISFSRNNVSTSLLVILSGISLKHDNDITSNVLFFSTEKLFKIMQLSTLTGNNYFHSINSFYIKIAVLIIFLTHGKT